MAKIKKTISIEAPTARVFAYVAKPENQTEFWPSLVEVSNVTQPPKGSFDFVYKMAGVKLRGHSTYVEYVQDQHLVAKSEGGIPATLDWTFTGKDGWTEVTLAIEYMMPGPVLGKLAEPIVTRINEHEATALLDNLKATLEGSK